MRLLPLLLAATLALAAQTATDVDAVAAVTELRPARALASVPEGD